MPGCLLIVTSFLACDSAFVPAPARKTVAAPPRSCLLFNTIGSYRSLLIGAELCMVVPRRLALQPVRAAVEARAPTESAAQTSAATPRGQDQAGRWQNGQQNRKRKVEEEVRSERLLRVEPP